MFETSLIESHAPQRNARLLATSAGFHLALIAATLSAAYWTLGPVGEPREIIASQPIIPVELPAAGGGVRENVTTPQPSPDPAPEVAQPTQPDPTDVPSEIPTPIAEAPTSLQATGDSDSPATDLPGSGGPGVPGGIDPEARGVLPGPPVTDDRPLRIVGGAITRPVLIQRVDPVFPELARRARHQGTVVLEAVIDERGRVVDVKVLAGQPYGLEQAAIDAVTRWRFEPARFQGRAVKVYYNLTVRFTLS